MRRSAIRKTFGFIWRGRRKRQLPAMWSNVNIGDKKQRLMSYIKQKKDEYLMNSDDDDEMFNASHAARSAGNSGTRTPQILNNPFPQEHLTLYPAYVRVKNSSASSVELCYSGLLWLPGGKNRKSRLMLGVARQVAGIGTINSEQDIPASQKLDSRRASTSGSGGTFASDVSLLEDELTDLESKFTGFGKNEGSASSNGSSTNNGSSSTYKEANAERVLRERVAPLLARAAPHRQLGIHNESGTIDVKVVTDNNGQFSSKLEISLEKSHDIGRQLWVRASDEVSQSVPIIHIPPTGVSVITDIDDTCKKTGVTGVRREMIRNVFVRGYNDLRVEGVGEWYQELAKASCQFHYVSNSPYQLYPIISEFLKDAQLPLGTVNLKQYSGFYGLFEPSVDKKKAALHQLLRDFPRRKFILIGDSGEADLEAYTELAVSFPNQIIALYIRDITTPSKDETASSKSNSTVTKSPYIQTPKSANTVPDLIDFGSDSEHQDERTQKPALPPRPRAPPPIPKKPDYMRSVQRRAVGINQPQKLARPVIDYPEDTPPDSPLIDWAIRVKQAGRRIPEGIDFALWKTGFDLKARSLELVRSRK